MTLQVGDVCGRGHRIRCRYDLTDKGGCSACAVDARAESIAVHGDPNAERRAVYGKRGKHGRDT